MTFVITLDGSTPSPRNDAVPWTEAQISYSPDNGVTPFVLIDTLTLAPVDPDPRYPAVRDLTTSLSPAASGWFQVTFFDAVSNEDPPTSAIQYPTPQQAGGASNASVLTARNAVRHRIRDGVPTLDQNPVPFNMVRLESLSDQVPITATPVQTRFQVRFDDLPTGRYMNAQVCPGTLAAFVDGSWTATTPILDVDYNGNFTLPVPPVSALLVTYAYQLVGDGEVDQAVNEARSWLREYPTVDAIPDGLVPALISYAAGRVLAALSRTAILATVHAGDSTLNLSDLAKSYQALSASAYAQATAEREAFYTQSSEARDPTVADVAAVWISPFTPRN